MPVAASIEKLLLNAINGTLSDDFSDTPELDIYAKDVDTSNLKIQLQMLRNLLKAYNEKSSNSQKIIEVITLHSL